MFFLWLTIGCNQVPDVQVFGVMNVDGVDASTSSDVDVYCASGICRFRVDSDLAAQLRVTMNYSLNTPFQLIEGAEPIGLFDGTVNIINEHQLSINIHRESVGIIQVVDHYRH